jgi:hypothetical protein
MLRFLQGKPGHLDPFSSFFYTLARRKPVDAGKWGLVFGSSTILAGIVAAVVWIARYAWHRLRWRRFCNLIRAWARDELIDDQLSDQEWKSLTAMKLYEAGFDPHETQGLAELAVLVAKGLASMLIRGRVQFDDRDQGQGKVKSWQQQPAANRCNGPQNITARNFATPTGNSGHAS